MHETADVHALETVDRAESRVAHLRRVAAELSTQKEEYHEDTLAILTSDTLQALRQRLSELMEEVQARAARNRGA